MRFLIATLAITLFSSAAMAQTIEVGINGLVCAFCVKGIEKSFKGKDEVAHIGVDLDHKLLTLQTKPGKTLDDETIRETITDAGFSTTSITRKE